MKEIWRKFSKWDKIGIYILSAMLVIMILGLILIGTISFKVPAPSNETKNGFWLLDNVPSWTTGDFMKGSKTVGWDTLKLTQIFDVFKTKGITVTGTAAQLQTGLVFAVIFTPILLFTSIGIFGFSFYLKKVKKTV